MRRRGAGRIMIMGSIAGFMPGRFQAVYNGTKAFIDSFSAALRNELKDTGITVTCLMPGPTETEFFRRADMMDTKVGSDEKMTAGEVARIGFKAMMDGEGDVVAGMEEQVASGRGPRHARPRRWRNSIARWRSRAPPNTELTRYSRARRPRRAGPPHLDDPTRGVSRAIARTVPRQPLRCTTSRAAIPSRHEHHRLAA